MNERVFVKLALEAQEVRGLAGHSTVGTNDLDTASEFYDRLLSIFGIGRILVQPGRAVYYGHRTLEFGVIRPFDGRPATVGNGGMVAFEARSRAQVDEVHSACGTKVLPGHGARGAAILTAPISAIRKATSFSSTAKAQTKFDTSFRRRGEPRLITAAAPHRRMLAAIRLIDRSGSSYDGNSQASSSKPVRASSATFWSDTGESNCEIGNVGFPGRRNRPSDRSTDEAI